jgi:hypothetical protein
VQAALLAAGSAVAVALVMVPSEGLNAFPTALFLAMGPAPALGSAVACVVLPVGYFAIFAAVAAALLFDGHRVAGRVLPVVATLLWMGMGWFCRGAGYA